MAARFVLKRDIFKTAVDFIDLAAFLDTIKVDTFVLGGYFEYWRPLLGKRDRLIQFLLEGDRNPLIAVVVDEKACSILL